MRVRSPKDSFIEPLVSNNKNTGIKRSSIVYLLKSNAIISPYNTYNNYLFTITEIIFRTKKPNQKNKAQSD
ncbi:hypothetical protein HpSLK40_14070 [Helicobacter pylori]